MIHPNTRLSGTNTRAGVGVFATKPIPVGTIVWVRDPLDVCLHPESLSRLPDLVASQFTRHAYLDHNDQWIMCWDIGRFINHHCEYNCAVTPWGAEIACRPIAEGEQLTNEYALFKLEAHEEFDCCCNSPDCRGHIDSREIASIQEQHDKWLARGLAMAGKVEQVLWPLLDDETAALILQSKRNRNVA